MAPPPSKIRVAAIELLRRCPRGLTARQIAEKTGDAYNSVSKMLNRMRLEHEVYILERRPIGQGQARSVYALGDKPDAPPHKAQPRAVHQAKYRDANRDRINAAHRARRRAKKLGVFGQMALSQLTAKPWRPRSDPGWEELENET